VAIRNPYNQAMYFISTGPGNARKVVMRTYIQSSSVFYFHRTRKRTRLGGGSRLVSGDECYTSHMYHLPPIYLPPIFTASDQPTNQPTNTHPISINYTGSHQSRQNKTGPESWDRLFEPASPSLAPIRIQFEFGWGLILSCDSGLTSQRSSAIIGYH
jgi:hypothetical protein